MARLPLLQHLGSSGFNGEGQEEGPAVSAARARAGCVVLQRQRHQIDAGTLLRYSAGDRKSWISLGKRFMTAERGERGHARATHLNRLSMTTEREYRCLPVPSSEPSRTSSRAQRLPPPYGSERRRQGECLALAFSMGHSARGVGWIWWSQSAKARSLSWDHGDCAGM